MIRGYRYRYVLIRDIFGRENLEELIKSEFLRLFGEYNLYRSRMRFYDHPRGLAIRVTLETLDMLLSVIASIGGVVERISGSIKKIEEI